MAKGDRMIILAYIVIVLLFGYLLLANMFTSGDNYDEFDIVIRWFASIFWPVFLPVLCIFGVFSGLTYLIKKSVDTGIDNIDE